MLGPDLRPIMGPARSTGARHEAGTRLGHEVRGLGEARAAATTETVREAMSYERQGWPMPISALTLLTQRRQREQQA